MTIDDLQIGQSACFTKTVSEADVYNYIGVSDDFNPAHINEEYSSKTTFKTRIAHGMIPAGFISAVLGTQLPGPGTIYLTQELHFVHPVRFGDTITAICTVEELVPERNRVILDTICINQHDEKVIEGKAVVLAPLAKHN